MIVILKKKIRFGIKKIIIRIIKKYIKNNKLHCYISFSFISRHVDIKLQNK